MRRESKILTKASICHIKRKNRTNLCIGKSAADILVGLQICVDSLVLVRAARDAICPEVHDVRVGLPGNSGGCSAQDEASDGEETEGAHLDLIFFMERKVTTEYEQYKTCKLVLYGSACKLYRVGNDSEWNIDRDVETYEAHYLYIFASSIQKSRNHDLPKRDRLWISLMAQIREVGTGVRG